MSTSTPTPAPATLPAQSQSPLPPPSEHLKTYIQTYHTLKLASNPIYTYLFPSVTLTHVTPGLVLARLPLSAQHMNSHGSLHGSVSATIVDWMGGLAIASMHSAEQIALAQREGRQVRGTGVSVEIALSYMGTVGEGEVVEIEGRADRVGGTLGFTSVGIWKVGEEGARGRTVALGKHTKFVRERGK